MHVGRLCPGGHFSSGKTGESVRKAQISSLGDPQNHSVWLVWVTVGELGLSLECGFWQGRETGSSD